MFSLKYNTQYCLKLSTVVFTHEYSFQSEITQCLHVIQQQKSPSYKSVNNAMVNVNSGFFSVDLKISGVNQANF